MNIPHDSVGSAWLLAAYRLQWLHNSLPYESVYRLPQKLLNRVALFGPGSSKPQATSTEWSREGGSCIKKATDSIRNKGSG